MIDTDAFLAHYGVKGMKWGVRRSQTQLDRAAGRKKERAVKKEQKGQQKAARKVERRKIARSVGKEFSLKTTAGKMRTGATVAGSIIGAPVTNIYVGVKIAQSSGYTKGKSYAVGIIGGVPGGLAAAELSARRSTRKKS